jgi:hypothetical protein
MSVILYSVLDAQTGQRSGWYRSVSIPLLDNIIWQILNTFGGDNVFFIVCHALTN